MFLIKAIGYIVFGIVNIQFYLFKIAFYVLQEIYHILLFITKPIHKPCKWICNYISTRIKTAIENHPNDWSIIKKMLLATAAVVVSILVLYALVAPSHKYSQGYYDEIDDSEYYEPAW